MTEEKKFAEVTAVYPNRVKISVYDLDAFKKPRDEQLEELRVGSYLEISDNNNCKLIAVIESYSIEAYGDQNQNRYIVEASPLGTIVDGKFTRGGDSLTIPPTDVRPANHEDIKRIYETAIPPKEQFRFARLAQDERIEVPVNGDKFFNKHFAIVGSTGSGKSHTVAKILQNAVDAKAGEYDGLNNSHIVIFDIHNEYKSAFPKANHIGIKNLVLPYWLLNSEELEELFLDTEANDHNQRNVFKEAVVKSKQDKYGGAGKAEEVIHYDSPTLFEIDYVLKQAKQKNTEMLPGSTAKGKQGPLHGKLTNFVSRLENKLKDKRLRFLVGDAAKEISFEDTIKQFIGYKLSESDSNANVTIIDLGAIPFEVLSITVSLISRILFEYGYFYKKILDKKKKNCETPLVLVYEEAHQYVPKSDLARYRSSRVAIERIAKEGRKYGVTLGIISQRPSEISETIFSQCSSFIAMRLTNPDDQNYVKRLLPDTLGGMTDLLPSMQSGEALLIGESIVMPSIIKVDECVEHKPSSSDIAYLQIWKDPWKEVHFESVVGEWEDTSSLMAGSDDSEE